ncbi:hypothetical protein GTP91_30095 [Rugamonas sp. FT82W]|uniref:Uncharacterized protein n=1 Tax=Duganella vulcania TaxID=2692166 RepID=A0A845GDD8_9BURK|nr:DUF6587 family protein [Duganella vulcania]MYM91415.1 hypothetical protein [Duganella vulcania]
MWQQVIVVLIVVAALAHFCTKYLPAALRKQIVYVLSRRGFDQNKLAKLFNTKSSCGDGCASCGSCETTPPPSSGASGSAPLKRVIMLRVQR